MAERKPKRHGARAAMGLWRGLLALSGMGLCPQCGPKPLDKFYTDPRRVNGLRSECTDCLRQSRSTHYRQNRLWFADYAKRWRAANRARFNYYSRTGARSRREKLLALLRESQTNLCPICGRLLPQNTRLVAVDHDHSTRRIRGLLCRSCNTLIGHARDDTRLLRRAIAYLERNRSHEPVPPDSPAYLFTKSK